MSDLTVIPESAEAFTVITGTAQTERDLAYFRRAAEGRNVVVTNVTSGLGTLLVTGPDARAALSRLTPADLSTEAFPFAAAREIEVGYARALAVRMSFAGEIGWELHLPTEGLASTWEALFEAWPDIVPAGSYALNTCRLEKGFRSWGHDIGPTDGALEAGHGFALDWSKDFQGRDALKRVRAEGMTRRLVTLSFDRESWPSGHHPVYRNGQLAGEVTSASASAQLDRAVALAWIEKGLMSDDALMEDRYEVEVQDRRYPAELHLRPLYDPKGTKLRA